MRTGIPVSQWLAEDPRALDTALTLMGQENEAVRNAS